MASVSVPTGSPAHAAPSPMALTSHPPVDGIRAVVVEKLGTGRLWEGYRKGGVRGGLLLLSTTPPMPPEGKALTPKQGLLPVPGSGQAEAKGTEVTV